MAKGATHNGQMVSIGFTFEWFAGQKKDCK